MKTRPVTVTTKKPISYVHIRSATLDADRCAKFQLSLDGKTFYTWNTKTWAEPAIESDGVSADELTANIKAFGKQFRNGNLYLKALISSENDMPCTFGNFSVDTSELTEN